MCGIHYNILLIGPPGTGKTMLAKRVASILPPMSLEEALNTTRIHSIAGVLSSHQSLVATRPYRSPHHTVSDAGLLGGGAHPMPGEVSLAHHGVLFLDELPEFHRNVLEVLRQPMEDGQVTVSRAAATVTFPCQFMLVAAMNPCPCGYYGDTQRECRCTPLQIGWAAFRRHPTGRVQLEWAESDPTDGVPGSLRQPGPKRWRRLLSPLCLQIRQSPVVAERGDALSRVREREGPSSGGALCRP